MLTSRLQAALKRLNPNTTQEAINRAIEELTRSRALMSLAEANRAIYGLLKEGVKVSLSDPDGEGETVEVLQVIDWEHPENNNFLAASQLWITGEMYTKRPDLIGFINGIPLVLMEFKRIDTNLYAAYNDNLWDYKDTIPPLFWYNAFVILSNGTDSKVGSLTASWEHFAEWKRIESEAEQHKVSLETSVCGLCQPQRLLDIIENFTMFTEAQGGTIKLISKNHQYLGVNNAIAALQQIESNRGKLGVFWHTQGSGKSVSMLFFAQKVLRKMQGNWTFVVVTDRKELDAQIYKNFASSGIGVQREVHAESIAHLRQLLSEEHRYIFTLIHKFQTQSGERHPVLSNRSDIIVITDEAHRSQYDTLALNMRTALPNAAFIAFTGTPLIAGEEKTREVFGDYVSVYDFKQSISDGATVPLYYENRVPKLQLTNETLNEDLEQILEAAELDEAQEAKIEREFAREYHLITRDERLETVAEDIVSHFMGRGHQGKAMIISIDKATAVKMFDKVQKYWKRHLAQLQSEFRKATSDAKKKSLAAQIRYMEETDMAVVVSQSQNEIANLKLQGVDIKPHRHRMNHEDLDTKFKNSEDPFRIVFVCAMWSTGFDVPACSTIYLDKPQRNHTLMQTIARANRVFGDKINGLIVDYIGVFRNLEKALAIYATGTDEEGNSPISDKSKLVAQLREAIAELSTFCMNLGIDLTQIAEAAPLERIGRIDDAMNGILINDETKRAYLQHANYISKLHKAILPDTAANTFSEICALINIIAHKIRNLTTPADISEVMEAVEALLNQSIAPQSYAIVQEQDLQHQRTEQRIDLSRIDFDTLKKFKTAHKRIEVEKLRSAINTKLAALIRLNKNRMDYQTRFEQMISEYNEASTDVNLFLEELIEFASALNQEAARATTEQLSEEELTVFDILTHPDPELTLLERAEVKDATKKLLETLKQEKLILDWRKQERSRAEVRLTVEKTLDDELPEPYTPALFNQKCEAVYQHIYDSYYGAGKSIYIEA